MSDQPPTIDPDPGLPIIPDGATSPPPMFNDAWSPQTVTVRVTEEQLRSWMSCLRVTL
jgi:hypothetical protein